MTNTEKKEIITKFIHDFTQALGTFKGLVPCIITHTPEDAELMKNSYKAANQMLEFIDDCDGDLGYLSEEFDIDKIIEEYPKVANLFNNTASNPDDELPFK